MWSTRTGGVLEAGEPLPQGDLGDIPQESDLEKDTAITDAQLAEDTKSMEI